MKKFEQVSPDVTNGGRGYLFHDAFDVTYPIPPLTLNRMSDTTASAGGNNKVFFFSKFKVVSQNSAFMPMRSRVRRQPIR